MRIALVHDWLTGMRGGEKVLAQLCELLPGADLFTLLQVPGSCESRIEGMAIHTSVLNDLPGVRHYYRYLLPIMPLAIERFDLTDYDLVISSSHCVAKGVIHSPGALHVCYCHTPMRYVWAQGGSYRKTMGLGGLALGAMHGYLRAWDLRSVGHVDCFVANSRNVARRIWQSYHRRARVIYPPIDSDFFTPAQTGREDFYLMVSALAPYKRVDQAVRAFAELGMPLLIIGSGQQLGWLRRLAPKNVKLLGWQSARVVRDHYRRCRALVFAGEEDFGMVPLEAMACGAAVIAYRAGGVLETVIDIDQDGPAEPTGLLYEPQTPEALAEAIRRFQKLRERFDSRRLVDWARRFDRTRFIREFKRLVDPLLAEKGLAQPWSSAITG